MTATLEVPRVGSRSSRSARIARAASRPWRSFGLMTGASLAALGLVIVGMTAAVEPQLPSVDLGGEELGGERPAPYIAVRATSHDPSPTVTAGALPKRFTK